MTSTAVVNDGWQARASALAAELAASGDLHDPAWAAAIAAVPRHLLVPTAYQQQSDGSWTEVDTAEIAYTATTLVTDLEHNRAVSSSTKPDLMVRMLEALDISDGHRVLEIGTGTGYNAALLAHRLGSPNVFSIDMDPHLIELSRQRLATAGFQPSVAARDGIHGWSEHALYDRIIATCSVPRIPASWVRQLVLGGKLIADVKFNTGAGNLAVLQRFDDRLEGHFTDRWAAFMEMRHHDDAAEPARAARAETDRTRMTSAPAEPWRTCREMWMMACLDLPRGLRTGYILDPDTRLPRSASLSAPDGSWCEIDLSADDSGDRQLREGGPTPLWDHVERARNSWSRWDEPSWSRFGLTADADTSVVWLDEPGNVVS
ncbi:methyltransferase domain-containing protein [Amycolatopsis sp. CA-230715]|uniref:methyltransferase domain-containing protein n=1 Tax=Amycolatopsis sp. CA-230715 TaxID=2745196 RepID=UPI001C00F702|nr:methyltransferase domain-containing protein [Amycolatopsis sp. CA-230715]QWF85802.1 Protein-L-isoaspartate O-methyltransferase [Amycolatopsis sp. CA-230715]